ncbi:MAG: SRPBCC family protein [Flavobacteriaceae bacterium]|nr:SRPBCC family protein [Flavobacteriaceae bacterium]
MNINGNTTRVQKSSTEVFEFLTNVENFKKLMPENIQKFEVLEAGKFVFALGGMPEIILKLKEQTPHSKVVLGAASDKIPFTLTADINEISANESDVNLSFSGEFNPMMAMMVKGPITKFVTTLTENLKGI